MKSLRFARAFGASFGLVMLGAVVMAGVSPFWGGSTPTSFGPWLGDNNINIGNLWRAHVGQQFMSFNSGLSVSQTNTQAACTQLNNEAMQEVTTSAGTGSVCLPTAFGGKNVLIGNASGQTISLYGAPATSCTTQFACSFVPGTQDTINGTTGSTAYTGLSTGKNVDCFSPANGKWYCSAGN